jgi:hypothetical protein
MGLENLASHMEKWNGGKMEHWEGKLNNAVGVTISDAFHSF